MRIAPRHSLLVLALLFVSLVGASPPEAGAKVYLLRMKSGFDLHLANRLTESGLLTVVTDAQQADYIFTESVGPGFEETMREMYHLTAETAAATASNDAEESSAADLMIGGGLRSRASSFGKASGMVFLVRRADSTVVWSNFLERQDTREAMLNKAAGNVVKRFKKWIADASTVQTTSNH